MTLYGNTLAWESSPAQTMRHQPMRLLAQPSYTGAYDIDQDPLWTHTPQALPIDVLAWYQCDHLGTPQELTYHTGQIAWSAQYKAWGEVKEQRSDWAQRQGLTNPIRFQGQYHDHETGLHYNRYRYYDPRVGRFISKDPISYAGGLNLYAYAPNPTGWVDPLGLARCICDSEVKNSAPKNMTPEGAGRRGAFNEAKRQSGIPTSQQPSRVIHNVDKRGNRQPGKIYEFEVAAPGGGIKKVRVRDDSGGHDFGTGNPQNRGAHFNDESGFYYDY
jgi:RHS repeat-associated protein